MNLSGGVNCVPGERLGSVEECDGGRGTYSRKGFVYSSRVGRPQFTRDGKEKPLVEVLRDWEPPLPQIGSVVTVKIVQVTQKQCRATIHAVDGLSTK